MNALELPRPESAQDLELERLALERDAARADADAAWAEVHRLLCSIKLAVMTSEGVQRMHAARKPLALIEPVSGTAERGTTP